MNVSSLMKCGIGYVWLRLSIYLSTFVSVPCEHLCTTSLLQSYIVHHQCVRWYKPTLPTLKVLYLVNHRNSMPESVLCESKCYHQIKMLRLLCALCTT